MRINDGSFDDPRAFFFTQRILYAATAVVNLFGALSVKLFLSFFYNDLFACFYDKKRIYECLNCVQSNISSIDRELNPAMSQSSKKRIATKLNEIIGWREYIGLPEFNVLRLPAKIDTGARTSALHAVNQELFQRDDEQWVSFWLKRPGQRKAERFETRVVDRRKIKNTSGEQELRLIIHTTLLLGRHKWGIDVSLADRKKMEFDIILGRTAIRGRNVLVHPGRSFILSPTKSY